jgi:hypothetical protein
MIPIRHRDCGGQIGWYLQDEPQDPDFVRVADILLMDGTHPVLGALINEQCPRCGQTIHSMNELERDFSTASNPAAEVMKGRT